MLILDDNSMKEKEYLHSKLQRWNTRINILRPDSFGFPAYSLYSFFCDNRFFNARGSAIGRGPGHV
jgi:hypothetical protein